jgi:beta-carotene 3-hydroxylase
MHGFLWFWHKSHHTVHSRTLERNDLFVLVFSIPAIGIFYYFSQVSLNLYMLSVGIGIFCYGLWRIKRRGRYLQRIINAHYIHHSKHSKNGCEAFGFLYAPPKYQPKKFTFKTDRKETQ